MDDLRYEIIYDMILEGTLPVSEMSFYITPYVKKTVKETPLVKKVEFIENIQQGDIIVAFSAKKQIMQSKAAKAMGKLLATVQGSPYSSAKFAIDDNTVAGYGIRILDNAGENKITKLNKRQFVTDRSEMILLRIPELTAEQKAKAAAFVKQRIGTPYNSVDLFKTGWNRLTGRKVFSFLKDKPVTKTTVALIQEPLFCSNMISLALVYAGFRKKFNNKNPWDVWPRDFITAKFTTPVCRVEAS